jgi:hypothetical protein
VKLLRQQTAHPPFSRPPWDPPYGQRGTSQGSLASAQLTAEIADQQFSRDSDSSVQAAAVHAAAMSRAALSKMYAKDLPMLGKTLDYNAT